MEGKEKNNVGAYSYFIISIVLFIFLFMFLVISICGLVKNYGYNLEVESNAKLTPIKAYEKIDDAWEKKGYIGPNGGIGTSERGTQTITNVYIDFSVKDHAKKISLKANEVYGFSDLKKCKSIVEEGDKIYRNIFYDSNNNVVGVSKGNPSVLNFYLQNSTGTFVLMIFLILSAINTVFAIRICKKSDKLISERMKR